MDVKAGADLELCAAPGAVLNVFDMYVELRFATSQGCEGWYKFRTHWLRQGWLHLLRMARLSNYQGWLQFSGMDSLFNSMSGRKKKTGSMGGTKKENWVPDQAREDVRIRHAGLDPVTGRRTDQARGEGRGNRRHFFSRHAGRFSTSSTCMSS